VQAKGLVYFVPSKTKGLNSAIHACISLRYEEICRSLHHRLEQVLYEGVEQQSGLYYKVSRKGKLKLHTTEETLVLSSRVHVVVKDRQQPGLLDLWKKLPTVQVDQTEFDITVSFYIQLNIDSRWQLHAESSGHFQWNRKARVSIGLLSLPVSSLIEPELHRQIEAIAQKIDLYLTEELAFTAQVQEVWRFLHTPHRLPTEWPVWLCPFGQSPPTLACGPLQLEADQLSWRIQAHSLCRIFVGERPASSAPPPLPAAATLPAGTHQAGLRVEAVVNYGEIEQRLIGMQIHPKGLGSFRIVGAKLHSREGRLHLSLQLKGKVGKLQLQLSAALLPGKQAPWFHLHDVRHRLWSENVLLRSLAYLLHRRIHAYLLHSLEEQLATLQADIKTELNSWAAGRELQPQVYISGQISKIVPRTPVLQKARMFLPFEVEHSLYIELQNL